MKLTYQTGIAALIQLAVMTGFNIANGLFSGVQQCTNHSGNCVSNIITSLLYFIIISVWFGIVWLLGAAAQDRRSRLLTAALIFSEFAIFMAALLDIRHHSTQLGLVTSIADAVFAIWVIFLAARLFRARGGRVSSSGRARQRRLKD